MADSNDTSVKSLKLRRKSNPLTQKVIHSNDLFLKNTGQFSVAQMRIFLYLLAQLPRGKMDDIPAISVNIETLRAIVACDNEKESVDNFHLKRMMDTLASLKATVMDVDSNIIITTWFDFIRISSDGDSFVFQIKKLLKPFLMELTGQFTIYQLGYALSMGSSNAIRLYDFLKTVEYRGTYEAPLDELRQCLGLFEYSDTGEVVSSKLSSYNELNRSILKPCIDQINEHTDIHVTYEPRKSMTDRRTISSVRFVITAKENPPAIDSSLPSSKYGQAELVYIDRNAIQVDTSKGILVQSPHIPAAIFHPAKNDSFRILTQEEMDGLLAPETV